MERGGGGGVSLLETWRILGWNTELLAPSECRMKDGRDKARGAEARAVAPQEVEAHAARSLGLLSVPAFPAAYGQLEACLCPTPFAHNFPIASCTQASLSICVHVLGRSSIDLRGLRCRESIEPSCAAGIALVRVAGETVARTRF